MTSIETSTIPILELSPTPLDTIDTLQPQRPSIPSPPRFYFAYGSNISLTQMSRRCPTAVYHSFGLLRNHNWKIGPRGYANVVPSTIFGNLLKTGKVCKPVVYGALYTLEPSDEAALDHAERVPVVYSKQDMFIEVLSIADGIVSDIKLGEMVSALVYVDLEKTGDGVCKHEYGIRLNISIRDGVKMGMPEWYVKDVLRKGVPEAQFQDNMLE